MHFTVGTYALQILSSHYFGDHSRTPSGLWAGLDPLVIRVFRLLKLNDVLSSLFCSGSLLELRNEVLPRSTRVRISKRLLEKWDNQIGPELT